MAKYAQNTGKIGTLTLIAAAVLGVGAGCDSASSGLELIDRTEQVVAFEGWLESKALVKGGKADGLFYAYYDAASQTPWFISTMVTAHVVRFYLRSGQTDKAVASADALLRWQHDGSGTAGERIAGAFPSEIERGSDGDSARYLYDSGDTLAVMEALLDVYVATGEERYLSAAQRAGAWLRDVMAHGEQYGVWVEAHGAPMKAVTDEGNFDNRIAVGRTLLWLPTLYRLADLSGDSSFAELANRSAQFLLAGQNSAGGFFDHYDPSWPAQPYSPSRFTTFGSDGSVVADDSICAALAATWTGRDDATERFMDWLPLDDGRVYGYLTLATGQPHFPAGNTPYFDLLSTALYRSLSALQSQDNAQADTFLRSLQAEDGGWYWGVVAETLAPITSDMSTLTGAWILADLTPSR